MFCVVCGNTVEPGPEGDCPVCIANLERGSLVTEADAPSAAPEGGAGGRETRVILCPECGNQVEADRECPVCADARERRKAKREVDETHFCRSCGNTFHGTGACPICNAGRAIRKRKRALCTRCGNEVDDTSHCPVCAANRASKRPVRRDGGEPFCPQCELPLEAQDWDGVPAHICGQCNGVLFPGSGLERTLDKLRSAEPDPQSAVAVFQKLLRRALPPAVRYKPCPVCNVSMTRRNYAGTSGIILDICPQHGTWIEQRAFGDLSEFVGSGADKIKKR